MRHLLSSFLIPPACPACGELLPIDGPYEPFCAECRAEWEREKLAPCPTCKRSVIDCDCLPQMLTENGIGQAIFLTAYRAGGHTVPDRVLYLIKTNRDPRVFDFLGRELSYAVRRTAGEKGYADGDVLITFLPRRRAAVREHGFDQAEALARAVAAETGYALRALLRRTPRTKEQKTLTAQERRENLRHAFRESTGEDLHGKCVFLTDDIVTTGSGLLAGAEILRSMGAGEVIPLLVARTVGEERF